MPNNNEVGNVDKLEDELVSIKKLLVLMLIKMGTTQEEIAASLGINQGLVSRMCPARKIIKFSLLK